MGATRRDRARAHDAVPEGSARGSARTTDGAEDEGAQISLVLDELGRIVHVSPTARAVFGARSSDLMGRPIADFALPEHRVGVARWLAEQAGHGFTGRGEAGPLDFLIARRHGLLAAARARPLPSEAASEGCQFGVELQEHSDHQAGSGPSRVVALQERIDHLEQSNRLLETLAGTAAHDLKSPLASLAASVQLLMLQAGSGLDEASQAVLSDILRGVGKMGDLVDGLLRCSVAGVRLHIEVADGDALVAHAIRELQVELDQAEAVVTVAPIGTVVADLEQLGSVFRNLLTNAVRYRSVDRRLRVWVDVCEGPVERTFTVSDNGRGIARGERDRVFAMFERGERGVSGSGIGLATCQRVIEGHGGRIWVDDGIDGGTAVGFTLPSQYLLGN